MNPVEKLKSILTGIKNAHVENPEIEKRAEKRAKLCAECPHANPEHPFKAFIVPENRIMEIKNMGCDLCGCLLSAKVRSPLERCPDNPPRW